MEIPKIKSLKILKKNLIIFNNQKFGDSHKIIFKNTVNKFTKVLKK